MKFNREQIKCLVFAQNYPGLHTYAKNEDLTYSTVWSLQKAGYLTVNQYDQFKITDKGQSLNLNTVKVI